MEKGIERTTRTLSDSASGNPRASDELLALVYDQLKALARRYMKGERPGHTLQPTAVVHEAYLRMIRIENIDWRGKTHFFATAARQMRRVLVDHARAALTEKRGGTLVRVSLGESTALLEQDPAGVIALEDALTKLAALSARQASAVEMRLFSGMKTVEIAGELGVSERTVKNDLRFARVWLARELGMSRAE